MAEPKKNVKQLILDVLSEKSPLSVTELSIILYQFHPRSIRNSLKILKDEKKIREIIHLNDQRMHIYALTEVKECQTQ